MSKCAVLLMNRGKLTNTDGINLPNQQCIKALGEGEGYKYLGILEADGVKNNEMKEKIKTEYFRRIRNFLKSKLNAGSIFQAINSRAVSIIRYGAGIVGWNKEEMQAMDRKTRKLLTIYRTHHPQADVNRLYIKRSEGGQGLIGVEDCIRVEQASLKKILIAIMKNGSKQ